jgi:DNA adenine methylase
MARDTTPAPDAAAHPRPPLKWAGGKRWQVPHVKRLWLGHEHRRLVEPFCGGLAISLGLVPRRALLNDVNPHLVNFYRHLKRGLVISVPMENQSEAYYAYRQLFNALLAAGRSHTVEAASLFYYLNRTGYNGLCRFNGRGEYNVPFGSYARIAYHRDFTAYRAAFRRWEFSSLDFEALTLKPDDFVYADPPYDVPFTQYARTRFTWDDQVRTAEWLARHPGPVVLANQATPRVVSLYRKLGFRLRYLNAPRMIACTGNRTPAREVLATRHVG